MSSPNRSYAEVDEQAVLIHFGTAHERVPLAEIANVARRRWPFSFWFGPKLGPSGYVSYVGSTEGVVQIDFVNPRPMNVWGPLRTSRARCAIVSLETAHQFMDDVRGRTRHIE